MKRFELSIVRREVEGNSFSPRSMDRIEADTMVELMAELLVVIARITREWHEDEIIKMKVNEHDDVPF